MALLLWAVTAHRLAPAGGPGGGPGPGTDLVALISAIGGLISAIGGLISAIAAVIALNRRGSGGA